MRIAFGVVSYLLLGGVMIGLGALWHEERCGWKWAFPSDGIYMRDVALAPLFLPAAIGTALTGDHFISSCERP